MEKHLDERITLKLSMPVVPIECYYDACDKRRAIEHLNGFPTDALLPLQNVFLHWWQLEVSSLLYKAAQQNDCPDAAEEAFYSHYYTFMEEDLKQATLVNSFEVRLFPKLRSQEYIYVEHQQDADRCQKEYRVTDKNREIIWRLSKPANYYLLQYVSGQHEIKKFASNSSNSSLKWQ